MPGGIDARAAQYLLGRNPLERDMIWHDLKRSQRGRANGPPGAVDVALWDIAGKLYGAPIHELLGGLRMTLPCYASTYHGDENGGLTRPEDFADFALQCKEEFGYPAFKIHGWIGGPIEREAAAVLAIRKAVGDEMALMLDPAGAFNTFDDVLRVGRACDEARYFWYEDAFRGGGLSQFAHAKLREFIKTPLLMGEHIRGLEAKSDTITRPGHRLRARQRRRGRRHHRRDEDRARSPRRTGWTWSCTARAGPPALHGGDPQHNYHELGVVHPKSAPTRRRSTPTGSGWTCWRRWTSGAVSTSRPAPAWG